MNLDVGELLRASIDRVLFIENYPEQGSIHDPETIFQHLPAIQSDIARLDARIIWIKSALTLLKNHRERLSRSVTKGRSLIPPPVHRLPSELLSRIFEIVCDDGPINQLSSNFFKSELVPPPPVQMSMVCAHWRTIALSTSKLWSVVTFNMVLSPNEDVERLCRVTEKFIARARTSPLTIEFNFLELNATLNPGDPFTIVANRAVDVLCKRSPQWFNVDFFVPPSFFSLPAVQSIRGNLPNLRNISIWDPNTPVAFTHILFDGGCPALRAIQISDLGERDNGLLENLPWQQVEELTLNDFHSKLTRSPLYLVSLCSKLKILNIDYNEEEERLNTYHFTGHVTSNINSLTLTMTNHNKTRDTWVAFFDHITLPRMSSLTLYNPDATGEIEDISPLLQCITRSACPITSLTLKFSLLPMTENHRLLSLLPSITTLAFHGHREDQRNSFSDIQLDRFKNLFCLLYIGSDSPASTTQSATPHLLPRLQHISFDLSTPYIHDKTLLSPVFDSDRSADGNLYRTVASRWLPGRREALVPKSGVDSLRSVTIITLDSPVRSNLPDLAKLRKLGEEGLEVFIRDSFFEIILFG
ncbi:hypothetical protein PM082_022395 [Marasmius tenuissimus]|nr:hypothetical protein PM082_022395 [Marasmius tenuissimus]